MVEIYSINENGKVGECVGNVEPLETDFTFADGEMEIKLSTNIDGEEVHEFFMKMLKSLPKPILHTPLLKVSRKSELERLKHLMLIKSMRKQLRKQ